MTSAPEPSIDLGTAEVEAAVDRMEERMTSPGREKQILVAGVGNAFLADDGFGGAVAAAVERRGAPPGVTVMDFGTGGLDLAYEVMRGYDALVIADVSRQGGEPGTLYVIEPSEAEVDGAIEDGDPINPHGMDPKTVLRFVKSVGGWPGKVVVVACEPAGVEEMGMELSEEVAAVVERAVDAVFEQVAALQSDSAYGE
jgi:hydrogenase maturation protease